MKKAIYYLLIAAIFSLIGWFANTAWHMPRGTSPISEIKPRPLAKYSIESLSKATVKPVSIEVGQVLKGPDHKYCTAECSTYEFKMSFDPTLAGSQTKTVSGVINVPDGRGPFPVIVMFRGFVESQNYFLGEGTQPAGEYFAKNGFITIAPDFLGFGDSDPAANDPFESRFQTYPTALTLFKSISGIQNWNQKNIFVWAHSNGGQIALETMEILGHKYPTALWAPVSKPFPYSILFFTDSPGDYGKTLRKALADFEDNYDADLYSIHMYWDRIKAPIQLNQGSKDESVPQAWSDLLEETLKGLDVNINYIVYPGNDHNMRPNWNSVVANNLSFYRSHLTK